MTLYRAETWIGAQLRTRLDLGGRLETRHDSLIGLAPLDTTWADTCGIAVQRPVRGSLSVHLLWCLVRRDASCAGRTGCTVRFSRAALTLAGD